MFSLTRARVPGRFGWLVTAEDALFLDCKRRSPRAKSTPSIFFSTTTSASAGSPGVFNERVVESGEAQGIGTTGPVEYHLLKE